MFGYLILPLDTGGNFLGLKFRKQPEEYVELKKLNQKKKKKILCGVFCVYFDLSVNDGKTLRSDEQKCQNRSKIHVSSLRMLTEKHSTLAALPETRRERLKLAQKAQI